MKRIDPVNLSTEIISYESEILKGVQEVLRSGQFINGPAVIEFESAFAQYHNQVHAIGLNSGTDALVFALLALGIGPGDEVITVPNSFIATVAAIVHVGARPVLVDVDTDQNMEVSQLERYITSSTKAIIPVHLNGKPAAMNKIMDIANRHGIEVIEDCSQAIGASIDGHSIGAFGRLAAYSLHPLKILGGCGDGGILMTNDDVLANELRLLRNHGLKDRDTCLKWGYNSRLDTLQAIILLHKIRHLDEVLSKRKELAAIYLSELSGLELTLPGTDPNEVHAWYTFVIQTAHRDRLMEYLVERGIGALIHYPTPIHLQPAAADLPYGEGSFPNCERQSREILSLPIHQSLSTEDVRFVSKQVKEFFKTLS